LGRKKLSDSKPKNNEVEIGKETIDRIVSQPTFNLYDQPQVGARFFIFKQKGQELIGRLVGRSIVNVRRNSSWPIELDNGEVVEIFANKTLHNQLKKCDLFTRIRIVYIGIEHTTWGQPKKIFRVYKEKE